MSTVTALLGTPYALTLNGREFSPTHPTVNLMGREITPGTYEVSVSFRSETHVRTFDITTLTAWLQVALDATFEQDMLLAVFMDDSTSSEKGESFLRGFLCYQAWLLLHPRRFDTSNTYMTLGDMYAVDLLMLEDYPVVRPELSLLLTVALGWVRVWRELLAVAAGVDPTESQRVYLDMEAHITRLQLPFWQLKTALFDTTSLLDQRLSGIEASL